MEKKMTKSWCPSTLQRVAITVAVSRRRQSAALQPHEQEEVIVVKVWWVQQRPTLPPLLPAHLLGTRARGALPSRHRRLLATAPEMERRWWRRWPLIQQMPTASTARPSGRWAAIIQAAPSLKINWNGAAATTGRSRRLHLRLGRSFANDCRRLN